MAEREARSADILPLVPYHILRRVYALPAAVAGHIIIQDQL